MHFAWCLVLMFGVPVRGLREAAEAFEARDNSSLMDHCCCRDAPQGMLTVRDCAAYKKEPEKPYWWHEGREGSVDRCCWIEGGLGCSGKSTKASDNYCDGSGGNVHLDTSIKQRGRDNGDVCCCKHQVERKDALTDKSETVVMEHGDCQMLKQIRADRPFWWHAAEPDGHLCCWTSGHNCVHTTSVLFTVHYNNGGDRISDDSDRARLCPDAKWAQEVEPHDKTLAWNFAGIELEREMHNALAKAIFNTVLGGAAAGSGVEHLQALDAANGMTAPVGFAKAAGGPDQKRVPMSLTAPVLARHSHHRGPGKGTWVIAKAAGRLFRVPDDTTNCKRSDDPYLHVSAAPGTDEYLIACAMLREDIKRDYEWFELHSFAEGGNVIRDPGCTRDYLKPEFRHGFRIGAEKGTDDYREACQMLRGVVPLKAEWNHDEWDATSGHYVWVIRPPLP